MSTLTKEQVMEKLEKLLRLGTGKGATEAEMMVALQKAGELAREHNIDLASVDASGEVKTGIRMDNVTTTTKTRQEQPYHLPILHAIRACLGVNYMLFTHTDHNCMRYMDRIIWVGERTDVAMAVYLWNWLQELFPKCAREWRQRSGERNTYKSNRSYFFGLSVGIQEANRRAEYLMPTDQRNRFAVVVREKSLMVRAEMTRLFPDAGSLRSSHRTVETAHEAGVAKGRTIKLNGGLTAAQNSTMLK